MDLLPKARDNGFAVPVSPIQIDATELHGLTVDRESDRIDLLIRCNNPKFVIAIENKIDSSEHSNQLERYKQTINRRFPDHPSLMVFLTREGDEPSDEDWCPLSYADLHRVFTRVRNTNDSNLGDDVLTFLDHYLSLIGSRFMDDPQIDALCQTIYKNHRAAIDLIIDVVGKQGVVGEIVQLLRVSDQWMVVGEGKNRVFFLPKRWENFLPPIGKQKTYSPHHWLLLTLGINPKSGMCNSAIQIRPTTDEEFRRQVIKRLVKDPEEFGIQTFFKDVQNIGAAWATLGKTKVTNLRDVDVLSDRHIAALNKHLDARHDQMTSVLEALQPIINNWTASK